MCYVYEVRELERVSSTSLPWFHTHLSSRELAYNIRQKHHGMQLSIISGQLRNRNFIYRMLFKNCYYLRRQKEVMFSVRSVCLSVRRITRKLVNGF